jgi:hypothetical protein
MEQEGNHLPVLFILYNPATTHNLQERNMETPQPTQGSNRNIIIGVVLAIVLCCCLAATAIGGYYAYRAYVAAQTAVDQIEDLDLPNLDGSEAPQGGRADPTTRSTAWLSLQLVAAISGCDNPAVVGTTITVLQDPDASGVWVEEWNVKCGDGTSQPFKVTFTPENGFVSVNVELP